MQDPTPDRPVDLGPYGRAAPSAAGPLEIAAAVLSLVWLGAVALYAVRPTEEEADGLLMTALTALLPVALLWMAVLTARSVRLLRQEAARLQMAVDAMRKAYVAQQQAAAAGYRPPADRPPADRPPANWQPDATGAVARPEPAPTVRRRAPPLRPAPQTAGTEDQPGLALDTPAEDIQPPLPVAEVIAALNFPSSDQDVEGIRALRAALADRPTAKLIRAAQDVLTLLAEEGIYVDDLNPEPAAPEVWRRFALGERGQAVGALGALPQDGSLTRTAARMRQDPVFRDAAHHFLRQFDRTFQSLEKDASDADLTDLAETRTGRAFLLFGRVSGTFD